MNCNTWPCLVLFNLFATTGVFGATIIWNGGNGTGTAIGATTNWSGGVSPNSANGDICQWDGTVPGNLFLTATTVNGNFNNGTPGVSFYVASNHVGSLNIRSIVSSSANIALNGVNIDSGAGAFSLGDGTANVLNIILRPSSAGFPYPVHDWVNNSTNAAVIYPNVRWQAGGGNPHVLLFDGTGDWIVTNNFSFAGGGQLYFVKAGSGTLFWSGPSISGALGAGSIGSPLDFEGGRVVLLAANLLNSQRITNNGAMLEYAAPAAQTLSGPITGTGLLRVSNGTLTLSGASDYTGNTILSGGKLIANRAEIPGVNGPLGNGGKISFTGGTLVFSVNNVYDYSPRFTNAPGQAISIDTAGVNVTFTNALTSGGGSLTKLGAGTLTLAANNSYDGFTSVSAGGLFVNGGNASAATTVSGGMLGGTGTLSGLVTMLAGSTLAPGATAGVIGNFSFNSNLNLGGNLAIEVNKSLSLSNDFVVVTGVLTNSGAGTLVVSNLGPALAVGDTFTLFSKPLTNGAALTVKGAGVNWINNLAVDGSISVIAPPTLNFTNLGGSLQLVWSGSFKLQSQTNNLNAGLGTNWSDYPSGGASPVTVPVDATSAAVFFRLVSAP